MILDPSPAGLAHLGATTFCNIVVASLAGCLSFLWMLNDGTSAWARHRVTVTASALRVTSVALLVAIGLLLWVHAAVMTEEPLMTAWRSIGRVAMQTQVGHAGLAAAAVGLVLVVAAFLMERRRRETLALASLCFLVIAATRSWAGHAGATGHLGPALVDWVHVVSVSTWAGGVFIALLVLRTPVPVGLQAGQDCAAAVQALSTLATWSLGAVLVTGALSAWRMLDGAPGALLTSAYSALLLTKLVFVGIAVSLGAHNRLVVLTPLIAALKSADRSAPTGVHRFRRALLWESLAFVAALGLASALGTTSPPEIH